MNLPVYNSKEDLPTTLNAKDIAAYLHISLTCAYTLMNAEKISVHKNWKTSFDYKRTLFTVVGIR